MPKKCACGAALRNDTYGSRCEDCYADSLPTRGDGMVCATNTERNSSKMARDTADRRWVSRPGGAE